MLRFFNALIRFKKNPGSASIQDWKKWEGKVLGSENDIKKALVILNKEPKDAEELQAVISKIRKDEISQTSRDSRNSYY